MGPTCSRKTELAIALRQYLKVELISVDSVLIYRGMDIGTAKPSAREQAQAPHRLIDIRDPAQTYSVANFYDDALKEMEDITSAGRIPLLVGGTMLYHKALLTGLSPLPPSDPSIRQYIAKQAVAKGWKTLYQKLQVIDPIVALRIHPNDSQRLSRALEVFFISGKTFTEMTNTSSKSLPYTLYQFAIAPSSRILMHKRIERRYHKMLEVGFEAEVQRLFTRSDLHADLPAIRSVGYRQMWSYLSHEISYDEMVYQGLCATRQLAKRQITWLRSWNTVYWLDSDRIEEALKAVVQFVSKSII